MDEELVKRLEELMGPNTWQQHKPPTPEPVPEPSPPTLLIDHPEISQDQKTLNDDGSGLDICASSTMAGTSESTTWPETGLAKGERSGELERFCPWRLVKNYPHSYIGKTNAERAKHFFDNPNIHNHHPWDLYYIYDPSAVKDRHILFVPTYQFENLLDVINAELGTVLTIPGHKNTEKFCITFGQGGSPIPRFLGRSTNFSTFEALKKGLPPWNPEDNMASMSTMAREDFLEKLKFIRASSKGGIKSKKSDKKRIARVQDRKSWGKSVKRVQRYLGIREGTSQRSNVGIAALNTLKLTDTPATKDTATLVPVVAKPERSVVFVSIDIEAYEFSQQLITEIGVAVFDTLDIDHRSPGAQAEEWFPLIKARHFRIKENAWAENRVHVDGHADKFDFG